MTIQITGTVVAANAASGAMIGLMSTVPPHSGLTTFELQSNPNGYFVLSAKGNLYVAWNGSALVGNYPIKVHAHGAGWNEFANFTIRVVPVPELVRFAAPPGSTPLPGGGWRVTTDNGDVLDINPSPAP